MNLIDMAERGLLPDTLIRFGIRRLLARRLADENSTDYVDQNETLYELLATLRAGPIALHTDTANQQHYEVPAEFFTRALGARLKYSCCFWPEGVRDLATAEDTMLALTCQRAGLEDGQQVLELGCGWGSLSLWMAEHYPNSQFTVVSNSTAQRDYIKSRCSALQLTNLIIITADMRDFQAPGQYDRIVSLEMFEHMHNWEKLFNRVSHWLNPGGRFFMHVFCHRELAYLFASDGNDNWMGKYFFTGGLMPSDNLPLHFQADLCLLRRWRINGTHYAKTCRAWLNNQDQAYEQLLPLFAKTYGVQQAPIWLQRWRLFFMACEELFAWNNGNDWFVSHYLFEKR